jgi:integrase/recombinase XerD
MIRWRKKVEEYVELRRSLGFKLLDARNGLIQFASFLEQSRATHITIAFMQMLAYHFARVLQAHQTACDSVDTLFVW